MNASLPQVSIPFTTPLYHTTTLHLITPHHTTDALDFFRAQKEQGLLKGDYDEEKYWEGEAQESREFETDPDWTAEEKREHFMKVQELQRTSTLMERIAKWVDRFTYW